MNSSRVVPVALLCGALLCLSTTIASAGCDNADRPKTPAHLKLVLGNPPEVNQSNNWTLVLGWVAQQTRTGTTNYDIHVRDQTGRPIPGMDVTGGAGQPSVAGQEGQYSWHNPPPSPEYDVSMRARTPEGCVSQFESETVKFVHVLAPVCPSGLVWRERFDGDTVCVTPAERDANRKRRGLPVND